MRHGRLKAARKTLDFFRLATGITPPYEVLLDGTFLVAIISQKIPIQERLYRTLQHQKFLINVMRSTLIELENLSNQNTPRKELFQQARQWGLDHSDKIIEQSDIPNDATPEEDLGVAGGQTISLLLSNPCYFVCTQDESLLNIIRQAGKSPLMRVSRGVLILENPSKASTRRVSSEERAKWSVEGCVQQHETKLIDYVKNNQEKEGRLTQMSSKETFRRKPKARGPNPLSCKRSRASKDVAEGKKQKRKRSRRSSATLH
mmetsp:Transcript_65/g.85  ORF Transcript_65/g.85 Transcript_65/m.85 type:complete len:260 (-) Transcript_65:36-815(-)|eukprot:CAMPEP_0194233770 /NCGR_PEP_ID=MMETSP0158-20130606/1659_1 /TAXON_ID=33649 /ORGANISM="Thalassionema nitzschioides, Strain L26-B" /LENGTH=259 /DNA_ID=CAMNT_0038966761 /DNA_START=27 /DNA_END=803 /DNA_ORIENTATION=-